jgi:hypothetical protein
LKRCTRPPSWSTAISNGGERKAWISAVSAFTCSNAIVIATEQDHAANLRMHQPFTLVISQGFAGDVDHYRAKGQRELR